MMLIAKCELNKMMNDRITVDEFIEICLKKNRIETENYYYIEVESGSSNSINRSSNKKIVVAYYTFDRLGYVVIRTPTRGYRLYRMCLFDRYRSGRGKRSAEEVHKDFGFILNLKFHILDKEGFEEFKKELIVKTMETNNETK